MKTGKSLQDLAAEIERRAALKKDFVAPAQRLEMTSTGDNVRLSIGADQGFAVNATAHDQIGTYTGIPAKYYDRMLAEDPTLLARNVNTWLQKAEGEKRMVRTLDGTARAFLSDKYRPLENEDLAQSVLPVIMDLGLDVMSCEITDRRFYLKVVDSAVTRELGKTGNAWGDGQHKILRMRTASPAVTISNSEVGQGALSVLGGLYDGFCSNLATFGERSVRKYHVGSKITTAADEIYAMLSDQTRAATDRALWMQLRDTVKIAFDRAKFDQLVDKVEGTAADVIEGDPVKVVSLASKKFGATEEEGKSILRHLIEGGSLTRFGLYNAVTRASQDIESYDRATDFEGIGGKIIELPKSEWQTLAKAA